MFAQKNLHTAQVGGQGGVQSVIPRGAKLPTAEVLADLKTRHDAAVREAEAADDATREQKRAFAKMLGRDCIILGGQVEHAAKPEVLDRWVRLGLVAETPPPPLTAAGARAELTQLRDVNAAQQRRIEEMERRLASSTDGGDANRVAAYEAEIGRLNAKIDAQQRKRS